MRVCDACQRLAPQFATRCPTCNAATRVAQMLEPGIKLGAYKITRPLGEGGMGSVLEANHEVLGRRSAIKLLHPELANDPALVARFLQEARAVNMIDHDHIVNIYDFSDGSDGAVYFVMEFLEGESLYEMLCRQPRLRAPEFFEIFSQMLKALAAAHSKQVIHRDLKPANVFILDRDGTPFVKLLDFGIAKLTAEGAASVMTAAGALMGTPHYMSPEQFAGKVVDTRTDIFALGVMMYQVLAGHLPFDGKDLADLAVKITRSPHTKLSLVVPDLEGVGDLEQICDRALAKNPDDRYQRVVDMAAALEVVRRKLGLSVSQAEEFVVPELSSGSGGKGRGRLIAGLLAAVAAIAVVAVLVVPKLGGSSSEGSTPTAADAAAAVPDTIASMWASDPSKAATRASAAIQKALSDSQQSTRAAAITALELVAEPELAPLLYSALELNAELRVRSAKTLVALDLPEAAGKLRAALSSSPDRLRVELAAALVALGDRDALAILEDAMKNSERDRVRAALVLATIGDNKKAKEIVSDTFASAPAGRPRWLRAARVLLVLKDAGAKNKLIAELRNPDEKRIVGAAVILAGAGIDDGTGVLRRMVADPDRAQRGEAAHALASLDDAVAYKFVADGLASAKPRDRQLAAAIVAKLVNKADGGRLAKMATSDEDLAAKLTASAALVVLASRQ